jgi:hypothetical protein
MCRSHEARGGPAHGLRLIHDLSQAELRSAGRMTIVDDMSISCRFTQDSLREIAPSSEILSCEIVSRSDEYCGQDQAYGVSKMARSRLEPQDIC